MKSRVTYSTNNKSLPNGEVPPKSFLSNFWGHFIRQILTDPDDTKFKRLEQYFKSLSPERLPGQETIEEMREGVRRTSRLYFPTPPPYFFILPALFLPAGCFIFISPPPYFFLKTSGRGSKSKAGRRKIVGGRVFKTRRPRS